MASITGVYADKGRSLTLRSSILDIRTRDYSLASTRISLDPDNEAFVDVGEWVLHSGAENIDRPLNDAAGNPLSAVLSTLAGNANALSRPMLAWTERGGTDVQALEKVPCIAQGIIECDTRIWSAEAAIAEGEELCVMFIDGSNAYYAAGGGTAVGFTGIKGILVGMSTVLSGAVAFGCTGGAMSVWVVGVALEAAANATPLMVQIHSVPYLKAVTVA